ncbi:MAG: DUF4412 domain-containing protein [Bacteroidetes bacterium]|nr:DUF4412 domain-containing protein [Bacteroidota bacterium]
MKLSIKKALLVLFLGIFCTATDLLAQKSFVEGVINYSVTIGPLAGGAGFSEHAGNYMITIKGKNIRKELVMNSGYRNVILENGNTGAIYSLQTVAGQHYAIQLKTADLDEKQKPYKDFKEKEEAGSMTIAGEKCSKVTITYKDGSNSIVYITKDWVAPEAILFDRLPGIKYMPLSFEYRNEEGITMHFAAEKIEAQPIESAQFRVPPDYKIISNSEYKSMRR